MDVERRHNRHHASLPTRSDRCGALSHKLSQPLTAASPRLARRNTTRGFSLIEILIVLAILGIVAALVVPTLSGDIPTQLSAAGSIVQVELEYARSLAVAGNSSYRVTINRSAQSLTLEHCGASNLLDVLPSTSMRRSSDPPDQQVLKLDELPIGLPRTELVGCVTSGSTTAIATGVEFTSIGSTTAASTTTFWLASGAGDDRRYLAIMVQPITGIVEQAEVVRALPADVATLLGSGD